MKFSKNVVRLVCALTLVSLWLGDVKLSYAQPEKPVESQQSAQVRPCPDALPSRLSVGQIGRVTPGAANRLRRWPYGPIIATIPGNALFTVVDGPQCAYRSVWWQVSYLGMVGWTAEGEGGIYYLAPTEPGNQVCFGALPTRLAVGQRGRVTPGTPNRLRVVPDGAVLALIPGGAPFRVVGGPRCGYRTVWWQVNYNGLIGWTREGSSYYWLEPRQSRTVHLAP